MVHLIKSSNPRWTVCGQLISNLSITHATTTRPERVTCAACK